MQSNTVILASLLSVPAMVASAATATVEVTQVLTLQSDGALLLDVRESDEYARGHAPGSRLISLGQLQQRLFELAAYKDKPVAVICHSGRRSGLAVKLLEGVGFTAAVNVTGGMVAWQKAGLPVKVGATVQ